MTLHGGSSADPAFAASLGEAIEAALAAEMVVSGRGPLPAMGREDRRLLFVAIGSGVLQYLARHAAAGQSELGIAAGFNQPFRPLVVAAASCTSAGGQLNGRGFAPSSPITLRRLDTGAALAPASTDGDGAFSASVAGLAGTAIDARDGAGNSAQAVAA